jgi:hypothetical protein
VAALLNYDALWHRIGAWNMLITSTLRRRMMAVVMIMEWPGITPDQYEAVRKLVNWEGDQPPGGMLHVAAFSESGLRVTDIWESAEQFQDFANNRLIPGTKELGLPGEPKVEVYPAHAIFTPGGQL